MKKLTRDELFDLLEANAAAQVEEWLDGGDGVVVYRNSDLGHPQLGHVVTMVMGPSRTVKTPETVPPRLPDGSWGFGWRYTPYGYFLGGKVVGSGEESTT